jgi:hypothetical protein
MEKQLNKLPREYLIECLEKYGYTHSKVERAIETEIDPSLVCTFLLEKKFTEQQRKKLQELIHNEMVQRIGLNFKTISSSDIDYLFKRIDYLFCGNSLKGLHPKPVARLFEIWEKPRKGTLGDYNYEQNVIRINSELLLKALSEDPHEVCNGTVCKSRVAVLQSVVEHEIVHMIVMRSCYERASHGKNFMDIARKIFGHTKFTHSIGSKVSVIGDRLLVKSDFKELQQVSFVSKNNIITGTITKLNPVNAVVLTQDLRKYNVPYYLLS